MSLLNRHGLPEEVVKALSANRYSGDVVGRKSDYSASTLISPTQQTILKKRYPNCSEEDVIDRVWSMFGSIAHTLLEEHGSDESLIEERFYTTVLGKTISGQVDHLKDGTISDYKTTSAFKITKKSYDEWERQLNIYAYLARINGHVVRNIRIIAIIRDWSEQSAANPDYPQAPIVIIPLTLWEQGEQEDFITERVAELIDAEDRADYNLPMCTDTDMWASPSKWAVIKEGGKRATKVCDTKEEADVYCDSASDKSLLVIERKGERRRCAKYCSCKTKCYQYQSFLKGESDGQAT